MCCFTLPIHDNALPYFTIASYYHVLFHITIAKKHGAVHCLYTVSRYSASPLHCGTLQDLTLPGHYRRLRCFTFTIHWVALPYQHSTSPHFTPQSFALPSHYPTLDHFALPSPYATLRHFTSPKHYYEIQNLAHTLCHYIMLQLTETSPYQTLPSPYVNTQYQT